MILHEQVPVKVNAVCDRGVAPLVSALNEFPQVVTAESCEDDGGEAYVSFHTGDDRHQLTEFVHFLSVALGRDTGLADGYFSLAVEWSGGGDTPLAYLRVPRRYIQAMADAITSVASERHERP